VIVKPELAAYRTAGAVHGGTPAAGEHAGARRWGVRGGDGHAACSGGGGGGGARGRHETAHRAHMIALVSSILVAGLGTLLAWRSTGGGDSLRMRYGSGCGGCTHFFPQVLPG